MVVDFTLGFETQLNREEIEQKRAQLEQAIAALEGQRAVLGDAVVEMAIEPLRRQLETEAAEQPAPAPKPVSERRIVTVLFCDMVGSTALAEQVDPEEWTRIMNRVFRLLTEPVDHYGGTVARLMGDAILAFFGAPESHEDDPERAILAGLRIMEKTRPYRREFLERTGMGFDFRVGINTGLAVVGEVGSEQMAEYTAMGDAVNVAARMEQTAAPGTVQISEATYQLVSDLFEVTILGPITVKGRATPVDAYQVLSRKSRSRRGGDEPRRSLVGRTEELARLDQIASQVRAGEGQIVLLIGEAGIGKSRLMAELRSGWMTSQREENVAAQWTEMSATSYSTGRPYGTFENQMRVVAGIAPTDRRAEAREKLKGVLATEPEHELLQSVYERLLGIHSGERIDLSGEAFKRALYESTLAAMRENSRGVPGVIVFDDLQWVDPASLALIEHTLQLVTELPLLFLLATRPESAGPAVELCRRLEERHLERYTELTLEPLTAEESARLADLLFASDEVPAAVRQTVLERAEGNPYFLEELVQMLHAGAAFSGEAGDLPANLMSLVAARMDRLPREVRQTLQLAAVIGRSFYVRVLQQISGDQSSLAAHLGQLETAEMVQEAARAPEWEYIFCHALTQEGVYSTLLLEQRRRFHLGVGEALKLIFPNRQREFAPVLAHHFDEGGLWEEALRQYRTAGSEAATLHANEQAASYYRRAIVIASEMEDDPELWIDLYGRLSRVLEHSSRFGAAARNYKRLEALGREKGEPSMVLAGLSGRTILRSNPTPLFDAEEAEKLAGETIALANEVGDRVTEARMNLQLVSLLALLSRFEEAMEQADRTIERARALGDRQLLANVLTDVASHLFATAGQFRRARAVLLEAKQLWRALGDRAMEADCLATLAEVEIFLGEFDQALLWSDEAWDISHSIHNPWGESHSRYLIGLVHWERGRADRAIATMEESIRKSEAAGFMVPQLVTRCELALVFARLGDSATAIALITPAKWFTVDHANFAFYLAGFLAQAQFAGGNLADAEEVLAPFDDRMEEYPSSLMDYYGRLAAAEVALARGDLGKALDIAKLLLDFLVEIGCKPYQMESLLLKGKILVGLDRPDDAQASLMEAHALGATMGSHWSMWQIEAELGRLAADGAEAESRFSRARKLIQSIHDYMPENLRASFLGQAAVQGVLEFAVPNE